MTQTALILGATGRFGRNMARAFAAAGWQVRSFDRTRDDLDQAARGADVIVHGWNPPYDQWAAEVPVLTDQVIAAARASGATVLVPGNVYVYGATSPATMTPDTPHAATNPLGRIRIAMERALADSGVPVILLRAGDFIDTEPSGNWFDKIITAKLHRGRFAYPGSLDAPHAWAFLPDYARAFVALAEKRADLPRFCTLTFGGYTLSGRQMATALGVAPGRFGWLPVRLLSPVWKMGRCLLEMRYLWSMPHQLDDTAFRAAVPEFDATPLEDALAQATSVHVDPDKVVVRGAAAA